jgi:NAD(P)-dependent dehydrogenase (short-subunit alcohol dehydrogenase family)
MTLRNQASMDGKICMVTGATSGIGKVAALELARMGATVIVVGRSRQRCENTVEMIRHETGNSAVEFLLADLSSQVQIRDLVADFKAHYSCLHVLVNNAGGFFLRRQLSVDGIEMTFALNHLNYFLLTHLLLDTIRASAPARVVNVSSGAHRGRPLDFENLGRMGFYSGWVAYGRSKFANLLFTYELARRLEGTGVTVNALHPGWVATNIGRNNGWLIRLLMPIIQRNAIPSEEGARTILYLASSPEVEGVTGKYFKKEKVIPSDPESYDQEAAARLWKISTEMALV